MLVWRKFANVFNMADGIIIATAPGRERWALDCSQSVQCDHAIVSLIDGYELGKLEWCMKYTSWDRFIFLQDSCAIYDGELFDLINKTPGSICLNHTERHFSCYLGVYQRTVLERVGLPSTRTKKDSILAETEWTERYVAEMTRAGAYVECFGEVLEPYKWHQVERHGRVNVEYSTKYLTKWQAQWGQTPLDDLDFVL